QLGTADSLAKARTGFEAALQSCRQLGDGAGEADAATGLARVQDALGEKAAAREAYERALERQLASDRPRAAGYVLNYAALVEEHLGTRARALDDLARALELARRIADRRLEGITLNNLGLVHYQLGDKSRALDFYEQAL